MMSVLIKDGDTEAHSLEVEELGFQPHLSIAPALLLTQVSSSLPGLTLLAISGCPEVQAAWFGNSL